MRLSGNDILNGVRVVRTFIRKSVRHLIYSLELLFSTAYRIVLSEGGSGVEKPSVQRSCVIGLRLSHTKKAYGLDAITLS